MSRIYSNNLIQEIILHNDIIDIVSGYVQLKKSGTQMTGLCPFHREKSPSFSVSPDKQLFYCFGCGAGGTVINFIMLAERLDFAEALRYLADRARIALPEQGKDFYSSDTFKQKQLIYKINSEAGKFFYRNLGLPDSKDAVEYLASRGLLAKTITRFGIGYAPERWSATLDFLTDKGFKPNDIIASGLASNKDGKCFDRFRNRIMFPILDVRNNVVGFGGRMLGDSPPKYLNTSQTIVFNKSAIFYGLNFAKNFVVQDDSNTRLLIVEGYMDVVSLHQSGIQTAIACLGTALTEQHCSILKRYCNEVLLCYDADKAGQAAAERAIELTRRAGLKARIVVLGQSKDPDEFINSKGVDSFKLKLKQAVPALEYRLDKIAASFDLSDTEHKIECGNQLAKELAKVKNSVELDAYIQKYAKKIGVTQQSISYEINKINYTQNEKSPQILRPVKQDVENSSIPSNGATYNLKLVNAEKMLISIMFNDINIFKSLKQSLKPTDFTYSIAQKISSILYKMYENNQQPDWVKVLSQLDENEMSEAATISRIHANFENNQKAVDEIMATIESEKKLMDIESSFKAGNMERLNDLLANYKA